MPKAIGRCIAIVCVLGVASCGGGGGTTPANGPALATPAPIVLATVPPGPSGSVAPVSITIQIPPDTGVTGSSAKRSPAYISTDIAAVDFRLTAVAPTGGGTYTGTLPTDTLIPITYNTGSCSLVASVETCTATTTAPAPATDTWTILTYSTTTPTVGTTTPLSVYAGYSLATTVAGPNNAVVATWGVPASLAFSPATVSNVPANVSLSGGSALTTSLQVKDAGGATLIGGNNFSSVSGTAGNVSFTGCGTHLTPTPGTIAAANPTALGAGSISVAYDGAGTAGSTINCYASAISGLGPILSENPVTTAASQPLRVASGPDGNLWFTERAANKIGKMTTAGVVLAEYAITTSASDPFGIVSGPDGNLWFTEFTASKIAKMTTAGTMTEYATTTASAQPDVITVGSDGNLWFTEYAKSKIGKVTTSGVVTEYVVPTSNSDPVGITLGPDGNLWFTESGSPNKVANVTTSGTFTEYAAPTTGTMNSITTGPDGNLWFAQSAAGIGLIDKVTISGTFTQYVVPTAGSVPFGIATGPDGNLWFTEDSASKIGKTTTAGVMTEYTTPTSSSTPFGITLGPDNNLWFAEGAANNIGKLVLSGGPLSAEFYVNLVAGSANANWTITSNRRHK